MTHRAICFHTERLHDDRVWRELEKALDLLDERSAKVTFLVFPQRALSAGKDIRERVRALAARGHEVGQHTHFYLGRATEKPHKRTDLSDRNVRACIERDYEWLLGCGVEPKGFCAGNFMMTEAVVETLAEFNFLYDCSSRLPHARKNFELPCHWLEAADIYRNESRLLVRLPNTESLTLVQCLHPKRKGRRAQLAGKKEYFQLVYNHDYDLLKRKVWFGLLWQLRSGAEFKTVRQVAELCLTENGNGIKTDHGEKV